MELPNSFPCRLFWEFKEEGGGCIASDLAPGRYNVSLKLACATGEWGIYCAECDVILGFPQNTGLHSRGPQTPKRTETFRQFIKPSLPSKTPGLGMSSPASSQKARGCQASPPPSLHLPYSHPPCLPSPGPRWHSGPFLCSPLLELPQLLPFCPLASAWNVSRV